MKVPSKEQQEGGVKVPLNTHAQCFQARHRGDELHNLEASLSASAHQLGSELLQMFGECIDTSLNGVNIRNAAGAAQIAIADGDTLATEPSRN